ncbi:hypothetical protein [Parabacteroides sp.]
MKEEQNKPQTVVNNIYGFQFNGCDISSPIFQTLVQGNMKVEDEVSEPATDCPTTSANSATSATIDDIPELSTPSASALMNKLVRAGILDEAFQPVGLSGSEKGVLANLLAVRLDITNLWQVFGALWNMKPDTLRSAYNKGMNQNKTINFQDKINSIIH